MDSKPSIALKVETLFITLRYVMYIRKLDNCKLSKQAYYLSRATGWYADVIRWAEAWDYKNMSGKEIQMH
jgi:hypothetical protein